MARTIKVNTNYNKNWVFSTKKEAAAFVEELAKVKPWVGMQLGAWNQIRKWIHSIMYYDSSLLHAIYPDAKLCVLLEEEMPLCKQCGSRMAGEKSRPENFMLSSTPPQAYVHCPNLGCSTQSSRTYRIW